MGISERRERERREVRQKILDAARQILVTEGVDAVSMRRIADSIEYSATTIYLYFEDKSALLHELFAGDFRTFLVNFAPVAAAADGAHARLRAAGLIYAQFAITHPHHFQAMFMRQHDFQQKMQDDSPFDLYSLLKALCAAIIEEGSARADMADAALMAQVCWSAVHGVAALEVARQGAHHIDWAPVQRRLDAMLDVLARGLMAQPPPIV